MAVSHLRLPNELTHAIIEMIWKESWTKDERWELYSSLSASSRGIRQIIVFVAARYIFLTFDESAKDIQLCNRVAADSALLGLSLSQTRITRLQTKSGPCSTPHWHSTLKRAHVHLDFTHLVAALIPVFEEKIKLPKKASQREPDRATTCVRRDNERRCRNRTRSRQELSCRRPVVLPEMTLSGA